MKLFRLPNKSPSERQSQFPLHQICTHSDQLVPSRGAGVPSSNYFQPSPPPPALVNASFKMVSNLCYGAPGWESGFPFQRVTDRRAGRVGATIWSLPV